MERALLFLALAMLAEIAGTVGGFGSSVFFVPIANFFFDFESVLGITAMFHLLSNTSKLSLFRSGFDKKVLLKIGVPSVLFALLGSALTPYLPVPWLKLGLGVFLIVFSAALLWAKRWQPPASSAFAIGAGALSGAMAGLVGTGGAVRGLALAAFNLPKDVFVATSAAIDMGIDLSRAAMYFRNGYIHAHDLWWMPGLAVVAIAGSWVGKRVLAKMPQSAFRSIALLLVFVIGWVTLYEALR